MINNYRIIYSYSRLWCYLKDPAEYYRRYVLKLKEPPTMPMVLGSIFSEVYSNPKFNLEQALINPAKYIKGAPETMTFTPDYLRAFKTALADKNLLRLPPNQCEQKVEVDALVEGAGLIPLMSKTDGFDDKKSLIVENKFSAAWSQERANTDDQLTFYSFVAFLKTKHKNIPDVRLQAINPKTGKVLVFNTTRTMDDFPPLMEKIKYAYLGITKEIYERV